MGREVWTAVLKLLLLTLGSAKQKGTDAWNVVKGYTIPFSILFSFCAFISVILTIL